MICPTCSTTNQRSTVRVIRTTPGKLEKVHFWDEDGVEHYHNPNVIVTELECSNGHRFAERSSWECSVCGYKACEAEIVEPAEPVVTAEARQATVRRTPTTRKKGKR